MLDRIAKTRQTYDEIAARFLENTRDRSSIHAWLDRFAALLPVGASVLDLGAGPGVDSAELRQRGLRAVSVDLSLGMLRAGCREFPGTRVQADIRRLPFRSSSVAGVWANASLLHLAPAETAAALREARRVLQARGTLHLSVKHGNGSEWETDRYGEPGGFSIGPPRSSMRLFSPLA